MAFCEYCGSPLPEGAGRCPTCDAELSLGLNTEAVPEAGAQEEQRGEQLSPEKAEAAGAGTENTGKEEGIKENNTNNTEDRRTEHAEEGERRGETETGRMAEPPAPERVLGRYAEEIRYPQDPFYEMKDGVVPPITGEYRAGGGGYSSAQPAGAYTSPQPSYIAPQPAGAYSQGADSHIPPSVPPSGRRPLGKLPLLIGGGAAVLLLLLLCGIFLLRKPAPKELEPSGTAFSALLDEAMEKYDSEQEKLWGEKETETEAPETEDWGMKTESESEDFGYTAEFSDLWVVDPIERDTNWYGWVDISYPDSPEENTFIDCYGAVGVYDGKEYIEVYTEADGSAFLSMFGEISEDGMIFTPEIGEEDAWTMDNYLSKEDEEEFVGDIIEDGSLMFVYNCAVDQDKTADVVICMRKYGRLWDENLELVPPGYEEYLKEIGQ